jgi:hypothetical protein
MKARVIYKEGREGENTLDAIVGIAVPMLDGREVKVFPRYKITPLLNNLSDGEKWDEKPMDEFQALRDDRDIRELTDKLLKAGSPAAKFVRKQGDYSLPNLLIAEAIVTFRDEINKLAKDIAGAETLDRSYLWSAFRYSAYYAWGANGSYGFFSGNNFYYFYVAVPVSL